MDSLLVPIILLLLGLLIMVIELFVPSGGAIGVVAAIFFFVAVVMAFMVDLKQGLAFLLVTVILIPVALAVLVKVWPHTPMGRKLFSQLPTENDVLPDSEHYREIRSLVGKRGIAKTKMLPSGSIRIDGKTYDAVSNSMAIDEGQKVEVVAIRANHIVVRPITTITFDPQNSDDILAQSPESLGLDSLDEPLD